MDDPKALAQAIVSFLSDPERMNAVRHSGLERYWSEFSAERQSVALRTVLARLVDGE